MHYGEFCGKFAAIQPKKILILGESHHISSDLDSENRIPGKPATYTTQSVVEEYFENPEKKSLRFFGKIAKSFGAKTDNEEQRRAFWNKVYFGNYVDVLCGIADNRAERLIAKNRMEYNDSLFKYINEKGIDIVFCFSRRTYNALPSLADKNEDKGKIIKDIFIGKRKDYIELCTYKANTVHKNTSILLNKPLEVYSLRHPSARGGYKSSNYSEVLGLIISENVSEFKG